MIDAQHGYLHRWNRWRRVSVNREILSATVAVGVLTAIVHVVTAAKDIIIAYQFGTADVLDAYLIAVLLPSSAVSIMAGSFASAFMPTYISLLLREGHEAAEQLLQSLMTWTYLLLAGMATVLALAAPVIVPFLGSGFSTEKLALTRSLLLMLLPVLVLKGLATVWTAVLNAGGRFSVAAGIPIFTPVVTVALLLVKGHQWGIYALVIGTVCGAVVETVILIWHLRRLKIPVTPRWGGWSPAIAEVRGQYGSMVVGAFLMSSVVLVDQAMAAMLGAGSVSALNYGAKMTSFVTVVTATALGTAVLPHFSRMVAVADWEGIHHTVRTYFKWILFITVPLTIATAALSEPLVRLIFQRGAFTAADTELVGRVQFFLVLQLPFYFTSILIVRLISSLKRNFLLMWGAVINFVINVVLNYIFIQRFQVAGIALATSIVAIASSIYLMLMLSRILKKESNGSRYPVVSARSQ